MNPTLTKEKMISPVSINGTSSSNKPLGPILPSIELAGDIRKLSEISESQSIFTIGRQWLWIVLIIAGDRILAPHLGWWNVLGYAFCVMAIASRQHCLLALMHEATHYRLSKIKAWNDFLSDMFCAFPEQLAQTLISPEQFEGLDLFLQGLARQPLKSVRLLCRTSSIIDIFDKNKAEYNPDGSYNFRDDVAGLTMGLVAGASVGGMAGATQGGVLGCSAWN